MSDGKVQILGGKVLISAAGKVAVADECCCGCCADQPPAVVSGGAGACDPAGAYAFASHVHDQGPLPPEAGDCKWRWTFQSALGHDWQLVICFDKSAAKYCAWLTMPGDGFGNTDPGCVCDSQMATDVTSEVACEGGTLVGTFTLAGNAGSACAGLTATVTLG